MPDTHSVLSPSASTRWLHCTPSARLEEMEPSRDTVFTREGTLAHEMAEHLLKKSFTLETPERPWMALIEDIRKEGYDPAEMEDYIRRVYLAEIGETVNSALAGTELTSVLVEQKVSLGDLVPGCWGTSDCIVIGDEVMHIVDLKYGKGLRVSAENNTQMMIYALAALNTFPEMTAHVATVWMHIIQPRLHASSEFAMTVRDLRAWGNDVLAPAARLAAAGLGEQMPGEWCRFCKIQGRCAALARMCSETAAMTFDNLLLTPEELASTLNRLPAIEAWCSSVKTYVQEQLEGGAHVPGWKLVEGRSISKIEDQESCATALLGAGYKPGDIYEPLSLKGVTALKKLLGKTYNDIVGPYIVKPQGKPTLAPEDDPRPELAEQTFRDTPTTKQ